MSGDYSVGMKRSFQITGLFYLAAFVGLVLSPSSPACDQMAEVDVNAELQAIKAGKYGKAVAEGSGKVIDGEVTDVCKEKGCWMNVKTAGGTEKKVRFENYSFFVPKTLVGHKIRMRASDAPKNEWLASGVEILEHPASEKITN